MQFDICRYLLAEGADPDFKVGLNRYVTHLQDVRFVGNNFLPRSPAEYAWNRILANDGAVETLLQYKQLFGDYNILDDYDFTTLHQIVLGLDSRDLSTYLQACPQTEIASIDSQGLSALHWATQRGDSEMIRLLLEQGSDPNFVSRWDYSAIHYAARSGSLAGINYLLKYGARVDARSLTSGYTSLLYFYSQPLSKTFNLACSQRLIEAGANVNTQGINGATPLCYASQYGAIPGIQSLLKNSAEIDKPTFDGETPLTVSVQANQHEATLILLKHGANLAHHTVAGRSLLHEAAEYGDEQTLRILTLARIRGVQVEHKSSDGKTARDLASKRTDVTGEWRMAFIDLLASVDESVPEPPPKRDSRYALDLNQIPQIRLSDVIKIIEDVCYGGIRFIYQYMIRVLPLRFPFFSFLIVFLAFAWYLFTKPRDEQRQVT